MARMNDLIDKLTEGTQQNRVPWKAAADEKTFIAAFGNLSVILLSESIGLNTKTKLSVLDERGNEIDRAVYDSIFAAGEYEQLCRLYQAVKQYCAVGADRKLAELISRIEAAPPISPS